MLCWVYGTAFFGVSVVWYAWLTKKRTCQTVFLGMFFFHLPGDCVRRGGVGGHSMMSNKNVYEKKGTGN